MPFYITHMKLSTVFFDHSAAEMRYFAQVSVVKNAVILCHLSTQLYSTVHCYKSLTIVASALFCDSIRVNCCWHTRRQFFSFWVTTPGELRVGIFRHTSSAFKHYLNSNILKLSNEISELRLCFNETFFYGLSLQLSGFSAIYGHQFCSKLLGLSYSAISHM